MEHRRKRLTREESRRLTRDRLLDSAAGVFARKGFYGASVEEIAEEAGYSRGAVYSNFAGKEEMFLALWVRQKEHDDALVLEGLNFPDKAQEQFDHSLEEDRTWSLLSFEFLLHAAREPDIRQKLAEHVRAADATFSDILKQWLAERNHDPALPVEHLALLLSAVSTGLGLQGLVDPKALPKGIYALALERLLSDANGQSP